MSVASRFFRAKLARWDLMAKSRLARFTLYLFAADVLLALASLIARWTGAPGFASSSSAWVSLLNVIVGFCAALLALRWLRQHLLWRLRNRLIVTYVFVGVIPVLLLVAMALLAGYLLAGQFATFVATA